jgi:hypothetical protein
MMIRWIYLIDQHLALSVLMLDRSLFTLLRATTSTWFCQDTVKVCDRNTWMQEVSTDNMFTD